MKPLRRGDRNQYLHRTSHAYRAAIRRKLDAFHVHVQLGCIAQPHRRGVALLPKLAPHHEPGASAFRTGGRKTHCVLASQDFSHLRKSTQPSRKSSTYTNKPIFTLIQDKWLREKRSELSTIQHLFLPVEN
jgi:hypothetical protein